MEGIGTLFYSACKSLAIGYLLKIFLSGINRKQYGSLVWMVAMMNVAICVFLIIIACVEGITDWFEPFREYVQGLNETKAQIETKINSFGDSNWNPSNWWNWLPNWLKVKGE